MFSKNVICVVGPTASGKTALSIALAKHFGGEIVSADSMQIYKHMDIGTAKVSDDEREGIVHHMIDIIPPSESYSVARYVKEASEIVDDIIARGKMPIIAGGTGLYVDSLISGIWFSENDKSEEVRTRLNAIAETEEGIAELYERLKIVDPESAEKLHLKDKKRIVRALEVYELTGKTISLHNAETQKAEKRYNGIFIGLNTSDREILYDRINGRVDKMMSQGLENEVRMLVKEGLFADTSVQAIGYKEMYAYIKGECSLEEAVELIKQRSRNYAKRQLTWLKRNEDVHWIFYDKAEDFEMVKENAIKFAEEKMGI